MPSLTRLLPLSPRGLLLLLACACHPATPRDVARPGTLRSPADDASPATRAPDRFRVAFETTRGTFVVEARREWAPLGADRLYALARAGFFDDSRFFRVVPGFIAQFGIAGDPQVAAAWRRRTIRDDPVRASNARGTVAYAMTGPDTRATQLYVNLADNRRLDAQGFAPVGEVVAGMEAVDALHGGYGERSGGGMRAGRQDSIFTGGNAWLDRRFPLLDRIVRARVLPDSASR